MMLPITISPSAFELPGACPDGSAEHTIQIQRAFCALAVSFLRDIEENCVILTDACSPAKITASLSSNLDAWPQKYRIEAKAVLQRLRERRRIISCTGYSEAEKCNGQPCAHTLGITLHVLPRAVLVKDNCLKCVPAMPGKTDVITWENYSISEFSRTRRESKQIRITFADFDQCRAEDLVFEPIMRYATHVNVVDRYIGRSVPARGNGLANFSNDYQRSLEWLIDIYRRSVTRRGTADKSTMEVWCGLETYNLSPADVTNAVVQLRAWEQKIIGKRVPNFKLHIKKELPNAQMPHARYLITDQATVLVDRGFDLLCSDSQMRTNSLDPARHSRRLRDCEVVLLNDAKRVITDIRRLDAVA